jgi:serine/threonine protein kinase
LKTFADGKGRFWEAERHAFDAFRNLTGMVRYLGAFTHLELVPRPRPNPDCKKRKGTLYQTYNILLEYGEFDLDEVFIHRQPPVLADEIDAFWRALFEIANVVDGIHNLTSEGHDYYGWHSDIKPANILRIKGGQYKLADPGFATFKLKRSSRQADDMKELPGNTITYGSRTTINLNSIH